MTEKPSVLELKMGGKAAQEWIQRRKEEEREQQEREAQGRGDGAIMGNILANLGNRK